MDRTIKIDKPLKTALLFSAANGFIIPLILIASGLIDQPIPLIFVYLIPIVLVLGIIEFLIVKRVRSNSKA